MESWGKEPAPGLLDVLRPPGQNRRRLSGLCRGSGRRKKGGAAGGMAAILENKAMEGLADPIVAVFASQVDARLTEWIRPAK